ncbi:cytochrome bc1 complex Rieske iron-sulfur subunit [Georgenia wangjunii]|uniref:cytochrome bc1 complex Rieske iron-sulfur subunit n=1 Tax=Georgenia wangjunii TaxID=3117730 RepID=UPI003D9C59F9
MSSENRPSDAVTPAAREAEGTTQVARGHGNLPERFEDPGLPEHEHRMSDRDPKAAKRAELQVVAIFGISIVATIVALWGYFAIPLDSTLGSVQLSTLVLGLGLGIGMLGIGVGAVHWAKSLMSNVEHVEKRKHIGSNPEIRETALAALDVGIKDANVGRRPLLLGALAGAVALAPLPFLVPLIGNLGGDWNVGAFRHTAWREGRRLATDPDDTPIRAADVTIGSVFQVIPHGLPEEEHYLEEKAKAIVIMTRLDPRELTEAEDRRDWSYDGIVAYSKVCTHVGCPVALYEQQTHHLLCPCHQSTFDIADGAKVVFGPANRPLPQLPITVDDEGYLVARSDFHEPVGPSYWERLK